jgi:hypothetical protein
VFLHPTLSLPESGLTWPLLEPDLHRCIRFIKWTQEHYSTQASRRELTQALEAATKALSGLQRYRDDVRLLRIWVQYVSNPLMSSAAAAATAVV